MRRGILRLAWVVPVVAAAGLLGCADSGSEGSGKSAPAPTTTPRPPRDYEAVPAMISEIDAAIMQQKGKVVLVDFWATWCQPCVASFPKLVRFHQTHSAKGLVVMAVSMDELGDRGVVEQFLRQHDADFKCFILKRGTPDDGVRMGTRFAYQGGIPHTVLFDRTGNRIWAGNPVRDAVLLERLIESEVAK